VKIVIDNFNYRTASLPLVFKESRETLFLEVLVLHGSLTTVNVE
jgi:hypothetical protein